MASFLYNKGSFKIIDRTIDLVANTIKVMLLKSAYTGNKDHDFVDDLSPNECDVGGYTGGFGGAGRKTVASIAITQDDTNDRVKVDGTDPSAWTLAAGNTLRYAAFIKEVTNDAASLPIALLDFGADKITNGGDFTLQFNADGMFYLSQ